MSVVTLKSVCELIVDCPHSTAINEGVGYPLVRTPNIGKGRLVYAGMHRVSKEVYDQRNLRAVPQENDIIFAREATAGNVAIIRHGEKVCLGQRTVLIRPNPLLVSPKFLVYFLLAPKQQYNLLSSANGATVAHVNMPTIRNLKVELPPLPTQQRIASILSRYDDLIENYQQQIKLLEEAAQRLYKEWFVDLHFPGYENTQIVDGVPEGWEKNKVSSILRLLSGYAFKSSTFVSDGKYKIVTIKNVQDNYFETNNTNTILEIPSAMPLHCILKTGDILLSLTGNVGRSCVVVGDHYLLNQRVAKVQTKYPMYVHCLFHNRDFYLEMCNLANGAAQLNLSPVKTEGIKILIPNNQKICEFEQLIEPLFNKKICLYKSITLLTEACDRLLPKLMSGEIEV